MTKNFDKLITDAAPLVPDCGTNRRVTRALLKERMRQDARRRQVRDRRGMSLAVSLVFMFVIGGQVTELGSDGFDTISRVMELTNGEKFIKITAPFRGTGLAVPEEFSPEKTYEIQQAIAADDIKPVRLEGINVFGKTMWLMEYASVIQGEISLHTSVPKNLIGFNSEITPKTFEFVASHITPFKDLIKQGKVPRKKFQAIRSNGLIFEVYSWTRSFPGFGEVTYYAGKPVTP